MIAKNKPLTIQQMTIVALMTALMCILGPISIPIGTIPISLTNFIIYLTIYLLGTKLSIISYLVYLLLGLVGLPIFSGFSGGVPKLAGPTGGYLIGFIFTIIITGIFLKNRYTKKLFSIFGMTLGAFAAYLFGTIWFILQTNCTILYALSVCVFPFLIGDAIKIFLAAKVGLILRNTLRNSNLL